MKRIWQTWMAGVALATGAERLLADPPQALPPRAELASVAYEDRGGSSLNSHCMNCNCERRGGVFADLGVGILKPYWSSNNAFITTTLAGADASATQTDFHFDGQFVPSARIGWLGEGGAGLRVGWWGFGNSAEAQSGVANGTTVIIQSAAPLGVSIATGAAPGNRVGAGASLHMDIWDFEVVRQLAHDCWDFEFSGGFRYAYLNQAYRAGVIDAGGALTDAVESKQAFTGYGMTLAAEIAHLLGGSNLAIYSNMRASVLFGNTLQDAAAVSGIGTATERRFDAHTRNERFMPVGELELGISGSQALRRGTAFFKLGIVGHAWYEAGNSSRSSNSDVLGPLNGGTTDDPNLGLFGFVFRAGVRF